MRLPRTLALRLRSLFRPGRADQDLDEEIRHHLALEREQNLARGLPPDDADRQARLVFGGLERTREAHRDARGVRLIHDFIADAKYALRSLRRNPVLTAAAVLTLALGIGANTAIFSVVNAVVLKPLPFPRADRLVMLWEENPEKGWYKNIVAPANMLDWEAQVPSFQGVAAWADWRPRFTLTGLGRPVLIDGAIVTGEFFSVLGVEPVRGRGFTPEETWQTGTRVAVISDRLWHNQFGADPSVVGRTLELDGSPVQVVGIMPPRFAFPYEEVDLWQSSAWDPAMQERTSFRRAHWLRAVARLAPGATMEQAHAELATVVRRLQVEYPATNKVMGASFTPLHEFLVGDTRLPLLVLLGAVSVLLIIACGNVGNLLLVRAAGREREAALRLALGAGRERLVRQALTESLVLSALGGLAGVVLGWGGTRVLTLLQPAGMLPVSEVGMEWTVFGYAFLVTTLCGLLFGLAPALWGSRRVAAEVLKDGGRSGSEGRRVRRWSEVLVVAEVGLALMLTVGAGLLARSFWRLQSVEPGFDPRGVLVVGVQLPHSRYDSDERVLAFFDQLEARARALPGVESAGLNSMVPLTGVRWTSDFKAAGWGPDQIGFEVAHREISPDYFVTMRVRLVSGRSFTPADRVDAPPVVLVNEALARRYFPGQDPVGQRVTFDKVPDSTSVWRTIVGVVADERQSSLAHEAQIEFIAPLAQDVTNYVHLMLRTAGDPASLGPMVRRIVSELDPDLAVTSVRTMEEIRSRSVALQRFVLILLLVFAGVGLLLAVVGVYGVMAQLARGRTRELGIRIALGAQTGQVQWLVVRHGLRLVLIGLAIGLTASLATVRTMAALLYQIPPRDPPTFVVVPILLVLSGLTACWVPAFRASRANPAASLRAD